MEMAAAEEKQSLRMGPYTKGRYGKDKLYMLIWHPRFAVYYSSHTRKGRNPATPKHPKRAYWARVLSQCKEAMEGHRV